MESKNLIFALMLFCSSTMAFADIYKCIDINGQVTYSPGQMEGLDCVSQDSSAATSGAELAPENLYGKKFDPNKEALFATDIFKAANQYSLARYDLLVNGKSEFIEKKLKDLRVEHDAVMREIIISLIIDETIDPHLKTVMLQNYAATGVMLSSLKEKYMATPMVLGTVESAKEGIKLESLYNFINSYYQLVYYCQLDGNAFIEFIRIIEEMNPCLNGYLTDDSKISAIHKADAQCEKAKVSASMQPAQPQTSTRGSDIFRPGSLFNPIHVIVH